ncbi:DUF2264 domain-containing protein [Saccharibacillus endophyticus]|uniref:DUF2264 domain-containing protein n=1 Tax=Saccharibacillus endophyticus TaxID=2060666 RepID=A0ABQ1ZSJ0_9BACL|nr:DUF2264 domain-containing protein [Saccharibacillus endophyticus]GGH73897.1 hypothetical protein GCM10007362_13460 [Saccharibacillus endophyticus]
MVDQQEIASGKEARQYWLDTMLTIADPVLNALGERKLKECLPIDFHPDRAPYACLEAFGRLICGMAPWLESEGLEGEEEALRAAYAEKVRNGIDAATDPASPDYMNFSDIGQPLVDAAFLAHALVRAPKMIAGQLSEPVKQRLMTELRRTRRTVPPKTNWLLFSAMVEAALYLLGDEEHDRMRIDLALHLHLDWYKGDGMYGDGKDFHWDYYNSFVIQPMLVDLVGLLRDTSPGYAEIADTVLARAARYASVLEHMIAPDGTYPPIGRSIVYRFGAFQHLAQASLQHFLEEKIVPAQVRGALTAVIRRIMQAPGTLDGQGWLTPGLYGHQPELAEGYISVGSLYLCSTVFLPLGLSPDDRFWAGEDAKWTSVKIAAGERMVADGALYL